ncbi:MAG: hypothetical protein AB8F95_17105 [Bacteroidia bacterium]
MAKRVISKITLTSILIMKRPLLLFTALLILSGFGLAFNCTSNSADDTPIIGTASNGTYTITYDLENMKAQWEDVLANGEIEANLSDFKIIYDSEHSQYLLTAIDAEKGLKAAVALEDTGNGNLYEQLGPTGGGLTVTCKGCSYACSPEIVNNKGFCSPKCATGDCTKTETLTVDTGIFLV